MTEETKIPSGEPDSELVAKKEESVSYLTYKKTLEQEKAVRQRAAEVEKELNEIKSRLAKDEEEKLTKKGEYEKLLKLREEELEKERQSKAQVLKDKTELESTLVTNYKLDAIRQKLPGKLKRKEYEGFIDTDSVVVNPDTGDIDEVSLNKVVSEFIEQHSALIDNSNFKGLPSDAPKGSGKRYSNSEWKSLSLKEKKENWSRRPL